LGATAIKRLVVALGLAVAATAVQAQTADDRVLHRSQETPSLATALRNWLASKTAPNTTAPNTTAPKTAPRTATTRVAAPHRHYSAESHQHGWRHARHDKVADDKASEANAAPKDTAPKDAAPKDAAPKDAAPKDAAPKDTAAKNPAPTAAMTDAPAAPPAPTRSIVPTMTTASADAGAPTVAPTLVSVNPNMPRTVATITVVAPSVSATRPHHGRSECSSGERIITAYYWEGSHTASGERFNPDGMTAAHRTYPFGTKLMVINPRNGKTVTVTVNDRGPFVKGVTLDLSRGAARAIGLQGNAAVCMAKM
jgi:rare lipoprotein A